ncbi:MAG: 4-(cytidine 5'-diphospho)-2-C-methyl-D-erythritol kinase [Actinomycetota bacterium]
MQVEAVARAKINLGLSVIGRRTDGYHDLSSVMQTVELTDGLTLRSADATIVSFRPGPGFEGAMPEPPDLVERAIAAFSSAGSPAGEAGHAQARVVKRIPMAAGLAGGSADAAAALLAMNTLAGERWSTEELSRICDRLGSDVPFTLRGGTALVTGHGERLCHLPCPVRLWWVLGIPALSISTTDAYRRYDQLASRRAPRARGREARLTAGLASGSPEAIATSLYNDLELAAFDLEPSLPGLKRHMLEAGALGAVVSGSGPTVVGLCSDKAHAEAVGTRAARHFARVEVVPSTRAGAEIVRAL